MVFQLLKSTTTATLLVCFCALLPSHVLGRTTSTTIAATSGVINFGSFAVLPGCANCSITISPAGVRSIVGAIVLSNVNPGSVATFSVTQTCNNANPSGCSVYTVAAAATAALPAGGVSMTLGTFTFSQGALVGTVNTLSVGATLTIPNQSTAGTFSGGGFTVTTTP